VFVIRQERPGDYDAIRSLNCEAFGGDSEACLVEQLRNDGVVTVSFVAVYDEEGVGHILFSELPIETESGIIAGVSLAPLVVSPKLQRLGIGSTLVRQGLDVCKKRGRAVVVVVGHRDYYPRFGFSLELAKQLQSPYAGEHCMPLELVPGVLDGVTGTLRYPGAFEMLS
jgi:putative acetyltransferase